MKRVAILAAPVLLAACATAGPDYRRPAGAVAGQGAASGAFAAGGGAAFVAAPVPADWWRLYRDPTLDRLVGEALAANTDLRVAAATIARARAQLAIVRDARRPQTAISAAPGYALESAEEQLVAGPLPSAFVYSIGANVTYQLDLAGQLRRAGEAASADVAASRAAYDSARVAVVAGTAGAYVDACAAGREIGIAERSLALQARATELTRRLLRAGRGISLDVTRSLAQQEQVRATMPTLLAARQVALFRLATLTGRPPAAFDRSVAACAEEPRLTRPIPIGDGAALIRRRPDIRRAEAELHAATARIGVAEAELYPSITLGAGVGSVGLASDVLSSDTVKYSLGPLVSWQFPNRTRVRARVASAQADADAAYARFDGAVLVALREVESALAVYAHDLDRAAALAQAQAQAARAARDAGTLFRAGRTGFLPLLDAERVQASADQALASAQSRLAADQIQLFLALGGGWQAG